jgi:CheY-like chemotaxis protein
MASGPMAVERVLALGQVIAGALVEIHGELSPGLIEVDSTRASIGPPAGDRSRYAQYAAPERLLGKPPTSASDVYSLGAILFHALAGRPPFVAETQTALMLAVCADAPPEIRSLRSDVPGELATVLHRAMAKDPAQRYASPSGLRDALRSVTLRARWQGKRMIAADDDAPVLALVAKVAERVGVETDIVQNGREVVDALKSHRYDVALLDLNMPRLDGWGVLDFLRAHRELKPKHLFIVTGFRDQSVSVADSDLVEAVLYKPVVPDELKSLVTACLDDKGVDVPSILRTTPHRMV